MDRKETQYKPKVYQNRPRGQSRGRQQNFQSCNRSFTRDRNISRGIIIIKSEIIGPTIEIGLETITDKITKEISSSLMKDTIIIDRTIEGEITIDKTIEIDKIMEEITLDKETGVRVEID